MASGFVLRAERIAVALVGMGVVGALLFAVLVGLGAGHQIMPVELAIIRGRIEDSVRVEPLGSLRGHVGAGPLNAGCLVELVVA